MALGFGSLALAAPAQAIPGTVHQTKTFTSGAGTWTIPSGATNITVALKGASSASNYGTTGSGGAATYSLADATAGTTLSYLVGAIGNGSPGHPGYSISKGGGGTAIGTASSILAVVGGGGGGQSQANPAGGTGGVSQVFGITPGEDGLPGFVGSQAPGQGGQATGGGATSTTAYYATHGTTVYKGQDGEDGPASVTGGAITLALGGFGASLGGGGGSGYTGGGGGTGDFDQADTIFDFGAGGGGSGYLAPSGISFVAGTAGTNTGPGSVVFDYDVPTLTATSNAAVGGFVGQAYSWSPVTVVGGSAPYAYSVSIGTLPAGLAISASTGAITGTPTGTGTTSFTVLVTDGSGQTVPEAEQIVVGMRSIVSPAQATIGGAVNVSGSGFDAGSYTVTLDSVSSDFGTVQVTGGGAVSFAGTIPVGASAGAHTLEVVSGGLVVASASITLVTSLTATPSSAEAAYQGQSFSWSPIATSGGTSPLTYAITAGVLPAGLTLDTATGIISGTPTTASALASAFSVKVTDTSPVAQSVTVQQQIAVGMLAISAPASAVQGQTVTITAQGLDEGDYSVELHSTPDVLGTVHVGSTHALTFTAIVPAGTDPGLHQLVLLQGGIIVATSSITVTAAPAVLSSTGVDVGPLLLLATLLLVAGVAIGLRRRFSVERA